MSKKNQNNHAPEAESETADLNQQPSPTEPEAATQDATPEASPADEAASSSTPKTPPAEPSATRRVRVTIAEGSTLGPQLLVNGDETDDPDYVAILDIEGQTKVELVK